MTKTTKIHIKTIIEEGPCQFCGFPLYVGDRSILTEEGDLFCSPKCVLAEQRRIRREESK